MNRKDWSTGDRDTLLECLAAELTSAAYFVALRHNRPNSWIDLELDLWRTTTEAVRRWKQGIAPRRGPASDRAQ